MALATPHRGHGPRPGACRWARPSEIYEFPQSRFVADFVGTTNLFEGTVSEPRAGARRGAVRRDRLRPAGRRCRALQRRTARLGGAAAGEDPAEQGAGRRRPRRTSCKGTVWELGYLGNRSTYRIKTGTGKLVTVFAQNERRTVGVGDRLERRGLRELDRQCRRAAAPMRRLARRLSIAAACRLYPPALVLRHRRAGLEPAATPPPRGPPGTGTVVLIVSDGLRWQEVFTGAEEALLNDTEAAAGCRTRNCASATGARTPRRASRGAAALPVGHRREQGQLFGNQAKGSVAGSRTARRSPTRDTTNEHRISNDAIDQQCFGPNPTPSVFEWLNKSIRVSRPGAVYGTWAVFDDIFNRARSRLVMQTGWSLPPPAAHESGRLALLRELYATTTRFDEEDCPNSFIQPLLLDYVQSGRPRLLFVGYGETDNWAHQGRYDLVLDAAHRMDGFVRQLWDTMQAMPQYRGSTTFIVTTDHGRGNAPLEWKEHGIEQKGSENVWIAVIGPDTRALGERSAAPRVTQAQIAATVAALLGRDYRTAQPRAAPPILDVLAAPVR